ncbi:hypothetical protein, partial [Modicisalibacter sp. MOD 31.J]|uniref:hypothetical protein n=1 Tax=Modicisalibacter sp. MOD 31.J TaxID=2831897 RepID=UPI001CCE57EC
MVLVDKPVAKPSANGPSGGTASGEGRVTEGQPVDIGPTAFRPPETQKPQPIGWGFPKRCLTMTYSRMGRPHTTIGA